MWDSAINGNFPCVCYQQECTLMRFLAPNKCKKKISDIKLVLEQQIYVSSVTSGSLAGQEQGIECIVAEVEKQ